MGGSLGDLVKNVITFGAYGQQEAQKEAQRAQQRAEMEARRIAAEKKPMEETATLLSPTAESASALTSLNLITEADPTKRKRSTVGLGTSTSSIGLGFGS